MTKAWKDDFHTAVARKNANSMRQAVANKLPINEYILGSENEFTPLHYAINHDAGDAVVEVLVASGADVNLPTIVDQEKRESPLMIAARLGSVPIVKLLIAAGANVNYEDSYNVTPLSSATYEKKPAFEMVMKTLIDAGAKSNYQAMVGAARHGLTKMVEMLVAAGAEVNEISRWDSLDSRGPRKAS